MWRFILITFAFLGWSFYVLSGGADYEPGLQSLQARAELNDLRPLARPATGDAAQAPGVTEAADETTEVTRALSSLDDLELSKDGPADVTLAALQGDATSWFVNLATLVGAGLSIWGRFRAAKKVSIS